MNDIFHFQSALIAFFVSIVFQLWVIIGASVTAQQQTNRMLPTSMTGCMASNSTNITIALANNEKSIFLPLYSISFLWYSFNGVVVTMIVGLICSLFDNSKSETDKVDPTLLISCRQSLCCFRSTYNISKHSQVITNILNSYSNYFCV